MSQMIEASTGILCSADKFYDFFRNNMSHLANIFPFGIKSAQVIEGVEGTIGCVVQYNFTVGGAVVVETVKLRTEDINDAERSVTYKALEGDLVKLYPTYKFTITVSEGSVKWTIYYEKASAVVPPPQIYMAFAFALTKAVDAYLLLTP